VNHAVVNSGDRHQDDGALARHVGSRMIQIKKLSHTGARNAQHFQDIAYSMLGARQATWQIRKFPQQAYSRNIWSQSKVESVQWPMPTRTRALVQITLLRRAASARTRNPGAYGDGPPGDGPPEMRSDTTGLARPGPSETPLCLNYVPPN
jgi:hypothetical protein